MKIVAREIGRLILLRQAKPAWPDDARDHTVACPTAAVMRLPRAN
jgi:hypothetical protein